MIRKDLADKIVAQALQEIEEARVYKSGKITNWRTNEGMYYGQKQSDDTTRANVSLGQMQEFVHTLLSKIDNPLVFKYFKRKNSQLKRVKYLNALRESDAEINFWDLKDIVGKKQAIIYGRAIYAYYADSINGYKAHLETIDVYDFLIDPSVSGIDIETAMYMGHYGVVKSVKELKDGVKSKLYHKGAVEEIIESGGNTEETVQEETNKQYRSYDLDTIGQKEKKNDNKFKFWQWITTYEGERYYLLMDNNGRWIRCEKLTDLFTSDLFPYWSWACFPDLTEFWTPSYCDYIREILMAQEVCINQMLDNSEAVNKPQKIVRVGDIEDMSKLLKYKKDGIIPVKKGVDIDKAVQFIQVPSINAPMQVFDKLQYIKDRASGIGDNEMGMADEGGKVGIYEGNERAAADRFGLLNKSYAFGYKRFAKLYEWGIKDHLNKKVAIDILGPSGVEMKQIGKRDIFKKGDEFGCMVEASNAEITNSLRNQDYKLKFIMAQAQNPLVNPSKAFELAAKISGLMDDEVRELLDVQNYGNEELMSEADRDIEALLNGEDIEINEAANNAYKQKLVSYLRDHKEDINMKQFELISLYIKALEPTIMRNEARNFQNDMIEMMNNQTEQLNTLDANGEPIEPPVEANQQYEI
jgi:hypothetical protein